MKTLAAKLVVDLHSALEGVDLVACGVDFDGAAYVVVQRSTEERAEDRCVGIFPKSRLDQPTDYVVTRWHEGHARKLVFPGERVAVSFVQPFAEGLLLVGARCHWRAKGAETNAVAIDWTGQELARFTAGDGIQDVRVTREGTIWVSYFDQGVFGNRGWRDPGPPPIGGPGLVAFSNAGEVCFTYDSEAARTDIVCDAYAMNVAGESDVWLYFHTEFPIVRIHNGDYRVWKFGIAGARAMAVDDDRVLLFGDYERRNLGRLVKLGRDGSAKVMDEFMIVDDHGEPLDDALAWGIAGRLFFFRKHRLLMLDNW